MIKRIALIAGPILAVLLGLWLHRSQGLDAGAAWTAGVVSLCAIWWIFEPIPIPVTSLIPLSVFPLVGVLTRGEVGQAYGDDLVLLMLGGFMLSTAMERSGAHRRLAINMVSLFGGFGGGRGLVFGFMITSAFLSMWISNAATTLMMLPIALAAMEKSNDSRLHIAMLLGVAYAASIGGVGTPIGTPPNLIFMRNYEQIGLDPPTFLQWMKLALPITCVMLPIAALWLTRGIKQSEDLRMPETGKWRPEEIRTLAVFTITAILWMTRKSPGGGWSQLTGLTEAKDASVALLAVVVMHIIPNGRGESLLTWESAKKIPWGVLILYGGGIAIAKAFQQSGLSETLGDSLGGLATVPVIIMVGGICLAVTFLTEVTSNTATATLLLPILALSAIKADIDPMVIMLPATISCSFAFMLPVATPPNAIVFSSNKFSLQDMAREGLVLNIVGVVVVTAYCVWMAK